MTPEREQKEAELTAEFQAARQGYEAARKDYMDRFRGMAGEESVDALRGVLCELRRYQDVLQRFHKFVVCRIPLEE